MDKLTLFFFRGKFEADMLQRQEDFDVHITGLEEDVANFYVHYDLDDV